MLRIANRDFGFTLLHLLTTALAGLGPQGDWLDVGLAKSDIWWGDFHGERPQARPPSAGVTRGFGRFGLALAPLDVGDGGAGVDRVAQDRGLALVGWRGFQIVGLVFALDVEFGSRLSLDGLRGGPGHPGLVPARLDRPDAKY